MRTASRATGEPSSQAAAVLREEIRSAGRTISRLRLYTLLLFPAGAFFIAFPHAASAVADCWTIGPDLPIWACLLRREPSILLCGAAAVGIAALVCLAGSLVYRASRAMSLRRRVASLPFQHASEALVPLSNDPSGDTRTIAAMLLRAVTIRTQREADLFSAHLDAGRATIARKPRPAVATGPRLLAWAIGIGALIASILFAFAQGRTAGIRPMVASEVQLVRSGVDMWNPSLLDNSGFDPLDDVWEVSRGALPAGYSPWRVCRGHSYWAVAAARANPGDSGIWLFRGDWQPVGRVVGLPNDWTYYACWDPTGRRLGVVARLQPATTQSATEVGIVEPPGRRYRRIARIANAPLTSAVWRGQTILVAAERPVRPGVAENLVVAVDALRGGVTTLYVEPGTPHHDAIEKMLLSPDGARLAFDSRATGEPHGVRVLDLRTHRCEQVTAVTHRECDHWLRKWERPDTLLIVGDGPERYSKSCDLYRVRLRTSDR